MEIIERKIGEVFQHENLTLIVVDAIIYEGCEGCCFDLPSIICETETGIARNLSITGDCGSGLRKDKKSVIFKLVEK